MSWGETLFLSKILKSQRKYGASDSVLAVLTSSTEELEGNGTKNLSCNFTPKVDGSVRIEVDVQPISTAGQTRIPYGGYFRILKDGVVIADSGYVRKYYDENEAVYVYVNNGIRHIDIPIVKNSKYTFQLYSDERNGYGGITASNIKVCGQVVDLSMLNYFTE